MSEILKEWLTQRLKLEIQWEAAEFGEEMKNGFVVACLLHSYKIINDDKKNLISSSNENQDIKKNWSMLNMWLQDIEIILTVDDLKNIIKGKGSTILRLFYQLFLVLDKKDRTDFIKEERKTASALVNKLTNRFSVHKVYEENEFLSDDLSKPLLDEKKFLDWQRKKTQQVKEVYDYIRHKYARKIQKAEDSRKLLESVGHEIKEISDADKIDIKNFCMRHPCKFENFSYKELIALGEKATDKNKYIADSEWSREYMKNLYTKMHKKSDLQEFQTEIMHSLSGVVWSDSVAENESKLDLGLAKKVMKLSQFEKQMCTQIMETKQQGRNLAKNRVLAEREFADERTNQFNIFLDSVKEDISSGLLEMDFEWQRQQTLHKRLYSEKMKRKRQHYYEICYDTILAMVDYATKYGYFKHLIGDDIPEHFIHEWKLLFYKQQPIFDIYTPIDGLVFINDEEGEEVEEEESKIEEILNLKQEKIRQECLNEAEFNEYHEYLTPWSLELLISNYDTESEESKYEQFGNRVLAHVVYTLLEIKYPYPPKRMTVDLPNIKSKALLVGLSNMFVAAAMQILLEERKIYVVRVESCIDFCLRQYQTEMLGSVDIELTFDKFMINAKEESTKELIKLLKSEDEIRDKSSELLLLPLTNNTKQTQTPKTLPEDQLILSDAANLGKYTYDTLSLGDPLTCHLVVAMIAEYIKKQEDINGFVIINYPNYYLEAQILEETFSGKTPPDEDELEDNDDIYLEESIEKHYRREPDPLKQYRRSKIFNNPHKSFEEPFTSFFSCYMKLKKTDDIREENPIWELTKENSELVDRFYAALGINYSMYYEVIEKEQLALICKYIIGDFEMPLKSYDQLFGPNVLSELDFPASEAKRSRSKVIRPEVSSNKLKDARISKSKSSSKSSELVSVKVPDSTETLKSKESSINYSRSSLKFKGEFSSVEFVENESTEKLLAGDEYWIYANLPIPVNIGTSLANYWEKAESTYVKDVEQLLLCKRLQINCLVPYSTFIKDKMNQIIMLPSHKQDIITEFQRQYNDYEDDWRDINVTKKEWHCRVKELKNSLYNICDVRKKRAEQQKHSIISDNWIVDELITLVNTYISLMQTELNRFFISYQILYDFYITMIKQIPPNDRLTSKELQKILRDSDDASGGKKSEDKFYRQLKNTYQDLLLQGGKIDYNNNPLSMIVENNVKFVLKTVKDLNDSYRTRISHEYSEVAKPVIVTKKKDPNELESSEEDLEAIKMEHFKCIDEWTMGINGEMLRANTRTLALQRKCYEDMSMLSNHISSTFVIIQNDINTYYMNEIKSVDRLCKYLQMSIEKGQKISEDLSLQDDKFVIDPNLLYLSAKAEVYSEKSYEMISDTNFEISHLAKLRNTFKILAPHGTILQKAFIYALQDFIFFGRESCNGLLAPASWNRVNPEYIPKFVISMFGENAFIDWRDFLIYCLNIPFPTVDELLVTRKKFRCFDFESLEVITRDQFHYIDLWFEEDINIDNDILKKSRKDFLFDLFEVSENKMNYSAFLLAFCKDVDPKEGFTKAISVAVGKKICNSLEDCGKVIYKFIQEKKFKAESLAHALNFVNTFLDTILIKVIDICVGITLEELDDVSDVLNKKGKAKVKGTKTKKGDENVSLPKLTKPLKESKASTNKNAQSRTGVCMPCDNYEPEEGKEENEDLNKEEALEEEYEEPIEDITIAYSVDQPTIWNVLEICLPWHFKLAPEDVAFYKTQIEDAFKLLEEDTEDKSIYIAKLLTDPNVCKFLHKTKKFQEVNFYEELQKIAMQPTVP